MGSIKDELARIAAERAKLAHEEHELIVRRQGEIGAMFAKAGLLDIDDAVIYGVLAEVKAETAGSPRLTDLARKGSEIAPRKPGRKANPDATA